MYSIHNWTNVVSPNNNPSPKSSFLWVVNVIPSPALQTTGIDGHMFWGTIDILRSPRDILLFFFFLMVPSTEWQLYWESTGDITILWICKGDDHHLCGSFSWWFAASTMKLPCCGRLSALVSKLALPTQVLCNLAIATALMKPGEVIESQVMSWIMFQSTAILMLQYDCIIM